MISKTKENEADWAEAEKHLDRVLEAASKVEAGQKIILVGPNASGKSLFRKVVNRGRETPWRIVHASMQLRTESRPDMGALSSMAHDWADDATSYSTIKVLGTSLRSVQENCALHIDEPEIGFSEELQAGAGPWLRKKIEELKVPPVMTMITTHSSEIAKAFLDWQLIDLGWKYQTVEEWVNRKIEPMDPEEVETRGQILFAVIQTRINKKQAEKSGR